MDMSQITVIDNYLVYGPTGEKVVWYECDPEKNTECGRNFCRTNITDMDGNMYQIGYCSKTLNPAYRKEGTKAWYAVQKTAENGEPYWGREYIEEV